MWFSRRCGPSLRPFPPFPSKAATAARRCCAFMIQVYQIREVTHVDGSGRLQTVYQQTRPRYWQLIECFRGMTGVPWSLIHPSTTTSPSSAAQMRPSTVSYAPRWTYWCWEIRLFRAYRSEDAYRLDG